MTKIHGAIYLLIGFFVSFVSWIFDMKKLFLFFLIGVLMAFYGLIRLTLDIIELRRTRTRPAERAAQRPAHAAARSPWKRCRRCGQASHLSARFCHSCGNTTFY